MKKNLLERLLSNYNLFENKNINLDDLGKFLDLYIKAKNRYLEKNKDFFNKIESFIEISLIRHFERRSLGFETFIQLRICGKNKRLAELVMNFAIDNMINSDELNCIISKEFTQELKQKIKDPELSSRIDDFCSLSNANSIFIESDYDFDEFEPNILLDDDHTLHDCRQ